MAPRSQRGHRSKLADKRALSSSQMPYLPSGRKRALPSLCQGGAGVQRLSGGEGAGVPTSEHLLEQSQASEKLHRRPLPRSGRFPNKHTEAAPVLPGLLGD